MVDKIQKFIEKLSIKEAEIYRNIVRDILINNLDTYDVKKLSGYVDLFHVRKGRLRIIFKKDTVENEILQVSNRDEKTYRSF